MRKSTREDTLSNPRKDYYVAVAVAMVASLTRFLFSHPICLVDMPSAFSSTGKFMKPTSRHLPSTFRGLDESISLTWNSRQLRKSGNR